MKSIAIVALLAASLTGCASASCDNAYDPDVCRDAPAMQSNFGAAVAAALAGGSAAARQQEQQQQQQPAPPCPLNCRQYGNYVQCN